MSIVREEHPCYVATCDRCGGGDNSEHGGSFHHPSKADAVESVESIDWRQAQDGSWLCLDCYDAALAELPCPHGGRCDGRGCGDACPIPPTAVKTGGAA